MSTSPATNDNARGLALRVREFINAFVIPSEHRLDPRGHGIDDSLRTDLQAQARAYNTRRPHGHSQ